MIVVEYTCAKFCTQQNKTRKRKIADQMELEFSSSVFVRRKVFEKLHKTRNIKKPIEGVLHVQRMQGNYVIFGE